MKQIVLVAFALCALCAVASAASSWSTITAFARTWKVKESNGHHVTPGGNIFSSDSDHVWVDDVGHLHLAIKNNSDGEFVCSEVKTPKPLGFGTYYFTVRGPHAKQDKYIVAGGFTYDDPAEPSYREIDFEWSRWGDASTPGLLFLTVHPTSNDAFANCQRNTPGTDVADNNVWTCVLQWHPTKSIQWCYYGRVAYANLKSSYSKLAVGPFSYSGPNAQLWEESSGTAFWYFNTFMFQHNQPTDGQDSEMVVENFKFSTDLTPLYPTEAPVVESSTAAAPSTKTCKAWTFDAVHSGCYLSGYTDAFKGTRFSQSTAQTNCKAQGALCGGITRETSSSRSWTLRRGSEYLCEGTIERSQIMKCTKWA